MLGRLLLLNSFFPSSPRPCPSVEENLVINVCAHNNSANNREEKCDVFATATANSKKAIGLDWQKKTIMLFCTFLSPPLLHYCDMKLPNFMRPLYGVGEHNTKILFLFF